MNTKNILSAFLLLISITFFIASTTINGTSADSPTCYNCGTQFACEVGGQPYGWTDCDYFPGNPPPDNCQVHGYDDCYYIPE